jgi:CelD/BcsL family acetyltransferase involved in cellulose biosynthesis
MEQGVTPLAAIERAVPAADSAKRTGRIAVEIKRDLDLQPADAAAMDALIASRPHVGVFVSRAWLSGLFHEPPPGVEPLLVLLRDGDSLRGVVAIGLSRARTHVRVVMLGGGAESDRVDLVAERGFETPCADALMAWIAETFGARGYVLGFRDVPAESPLWGALHRGNDAGTRRLAFLPRDVHTLPYLDLAEARNESLTSLAKHRRWLERRGRLRVELLREPSDALAAFATLGEFLHARWSGAGQHSALDSPATGRFHRHVIPLLLAGGTLRMIRISIDMRTVGVFYGMAIGNWWGYYLAGYDREWAGRIHLGQITLATAIEMAARDGGREFDFLKGVERVKYLWPVRERSSVDADAYSSHWGSQLHRAAHAGRDLAAATIKSLRQLLPAPSRP